MKRSPSAPNPQAYVDGLTGWRHDLVAELRAGVLRAAPLTEAIKWGHLVYSAEGPVLLIRAEEERVLFGFWRGRLLRDLEPRLKPGGKYDMATITFRRGDTIARVAVTKLVKAAVALNEEQGDPTDLARAGSRR